MFITGHLSEILTKIMGIDVKVGRTPQVLSAASIRPLENIQ